MSRKRVIMEIDETGQIYGPDNYFIGNANMGTNPHFGEYTERKAVKTVLKLKDAGFTAENILEMKEAGLI